MQLVSKTWRNVRYVTLDQLGPLQVQSGAIWGPRVVVTYFLILYIQLLATPIHEPYHPPGVSHAWFGQTDRFGLEIRIGYRELIGTTPWRSAVLSHW